MASMSDSNAKIDHEYSKSNVMEPMDEGSPPPHKPSDDIPNGGLKAWLQVVGSFMAYLNTWGIVNSFGGFQNYYSAHLLSHVSDSDISWIGSIHGFVLCLTGFLTGPLFDLGYAYPMIYIGSFLVVFGMFMTSLCTEYWQFMLAQGVCIGLGSGCLIIPSVGILPTYFTTKKGLATGIAASGSSVAGIIYPIVFTRLQAQIGFPWATRVIAFIMLFTLSISIATFRVRVLPPERRRLYDPKALKDVPFVLFNMTAFFASMGLYIPYFYIATYARSQANMSPSLAFYMVPILGAGSAFGRILPNFFADRAGSLNMLTICTTIATVIAFCWLAIGNVPGIIVFCVLYGFFSGTFVSLQPTSVVTLSPSLGIFGTRMGMNTLSCGLGTLIGTPVAGAIVANGNWVGLKVFCGCILAAGSVFVAVAKLKKNRDLMARV